MKNSLSSSLSARSRRVCMVAFALAAPFAAVQLSGCGGGGGGGGGTTFQQPTANVTFLLVDENGADTGGTVQLSQGATVIGVQQSLNNRPIVFNNIKTGNYNVIFTDSNGTTTQATIAVASEANQTFQLTSGQSTAPNQGFTISGIVQLNSTVSNTASCGDSSEGIAERLIIRVRDANQPDRPIVASTEKSFQNANVVPASQLGAFRIGSIPGPGTYIIEAITASANSNDPTPERFTGRSPAFTITDSQTSIRGLKICANSGRFAPGDVPAPTP